MRPKGLAALLATVFCLVVSAAFAGTSNVDDFDAHGVTLTKELYRGRDAIKVTGSKSADGTADAIAVLKNTSFRNGTIEGWLAGAPIDDDAAAGGARGFVGMAFRVADPNRYEAIYRPHAPNFL